MGSQLELRGKSARGYEESCEVAMAGTGKFSVSWAQGLN